MTVYHIPTVYLITGMLYLILPLTIWFVLINQPSKAKSLWCAGGGLFGVGLLMVGLRAQLPAWVTYPLANGLMWFAVALQATALRRALDLSFALKKTVLLVAVSVSVFEFFRLGLQDAILRFSWSMLIFMVLFAYIAYLAWRISTTHQLKSGRWLAAVYAITAILMFIRMQRVILGLTEPDAVANGVDSGLTVMNGILISIFGNFAFVGIFLERSSQAEIRATAERVRQEESARLGEQIAQLERQRTLGTMSASFAHELSQPLTAILMDTHAIKSSLSANQLNVSEIKESIEDVERSAKRTVQLVERIRSFVRPTQGDYEDVDMKVLVHDVQHLLAHDIRAQNVQFEWNFDDSACLVHGDKIQLSQIVLNVYRNAIQAMASADLRKISVSLEREDQRVVLHVHDSGAGLDDAVKDQVGQPFVTTKREGLGVGLSISKTIAEMHNGSLTITNAVGGGALVELNLPAVNA